MDTRKESMTNPRTLISEITDDYTQRSVTFLIVWILTVYSLYASTNTKQGSSCLWVNTLGGSGIVSRRFMSGVIVRGFVLNSCPGVTESFCPVAG